VTSAVENKALTLLDVIIHVVLFGEKSRAVRWTTTCQETQAGVLPYLIILLIACIHNRILWRQFHIHPVAISLSYSLQTALPAAS